MEPFSAVPGGCPDEGKAALAATGVCQSLARNDQNLVVACAGLQPDHFQLRERGFKMDTFIADFQHQNTCIGHVSGCIAQQVADILKGKGTAAKKLEAIAELEAIAKILEGDAS